MSEDNRWEPSAKSRRCYHRVISGIERGGQLRFLTLTSSNESPDTCQRSFRALYMRLQRRGLIKGYIKVPESQPNGKQHLHVLFRGSYIEQALLSKWWEEIHHARVVDIRKVKHLNTKRRVAGYMAKYMSKDTAFRYSWSWPWVWKGFCRDWKRLKRGIYAYYGTYAGEARETLLRSWNDWLKGRWQPDWNLIDNDLFWKARGYKAYPRYDDV